jgi:hypothetical protein
VILSAEGRLPPVFGDGLYTEVVTDANDVQISVRHGVDFGSNEGQFSDWSPVKNYSLKEVVRYTDGDCYISQSNNNLGNTPADDSNKWSKILFIEVWNPNKTGGYSEDDVAVDGGYLFRSKIDDNESLTSDTDDWENLSFNNYIDGDLTVTGGITSSHEGAARRNATISMTTDTTLNKDAQLTITGLASGFYQVSGMIVFNTNSGGAANGLKITLDGDATTALQVVTWQRFSATAAVDALTSTTPVFESAGGSDNYIVFSGTIRLDSGGELAVWVAQNASSATAVEIKTGSSLIARRIGDGV